MFLATKAAETQGKGSVAPLQSGHIRLEPVSPAEMSCITRNTKVRLHQLNRTPQLLW